MKLLIIGGSRGIGKETSRLALQAGHEVTVLARHPESIGLQHKNLHLVSGDVLDAPVVARAVKGQQAVICTLGLPSRLAMGPPLAKRSYVLSAGTANVIRAMEAEGLQRLLLVTATGTGDSARYCTATARFALRGVLRWLFQEKDRQEALLQASALNWTILRPTALTNGKAKGAEATETPVHSGLLTQVSRADVAQSLLAAIDDKAANRKTLYISYPPHFGDSLRWIAGYFGKG